MWSSPILAALLKHVHLHCTKYSYRSFHSILWQFALDALVYSTYLMALIMMSFAFLSAKQDMSPTNVEWEINKQKYSQRDCKRQRLGVGKM